ncbi:MAG TPA: SDR family NAD(P)-dependent oxidoreductase [Acidimicrobiia bacterium]|nr:SDR family NAD(P)-dependent oxidoreductase [Acidimicrobiia bacterium]
MSDRPLAVITGAGRGIGREIALALSAAGFELVLAARSVEELEAVAGEVADRGGQAWVVPTDLREEADVEQLALEAQERGPVEVLVNNSGIAGPSGMLWELDLKQWEETMAVNVTGVFLCCRDFLPGMIERRRGSIINIGSITGKRPLFGRTPYATSKMALVGLTRTLALEAGQYGIRVNLISPGFVAGPRIERVIAMQAEAREVEPEEVRAEFEKESPLRRLTLPEEVARTVVFLASEAASGITGADVNVNAGVVMY